jgi:ATP-dependent HslUV protease ATP-binding subunit HslU
VSIDEYKGKEFVIDKNYVKSKLDDIVESEEITKYIL